MKRRVYLLIATLLAIAAGAAVIVLSARQALPSKPLEGHDQLVLVVSRTETAAAATILTFDRGGGTWRLVTAAPAVIGENGMAWGIGLHDERDTGDEPKKQDGDRRTPKGVFDLTTAYGTLPPYAVNIKFPYVQSTPDLICVTDEHSTYYNRVVLSGDIAPQEPDLPHVNLQSEDGQYKYFIMIDQNQKRVPGAGRCLFIRLWKDEKTPTDGSTAVSEETMVSILGWLDPGRKPVLVQLTRTSYRRLRELWGLPEVTL